ncbi:hypothetical protein [Streptomyces sp. SPB78]|uniref:hypothetical protein n=1 Tax=Streptomyces sp. (strain SPB78) TaxID=591157 RepID=UPI0001B54A1D|nr:hypothetical protein [Streptomyces sp. SPB78]
MTLAYLLVLLGSLAVLAVALRPRRAPAPAPLSPTPAPLGLVEPSADVHVILAAAHRLAARLDLDAAA